MSWEVVIGLEIHVQLNTVSKLFSGSKLSTGAEPKKSTKKTKCIKHHTNATQ